MKDWSNLEREDLKHIPLMEENGFKPDFSWHDEHYKRTTLENVPHFPVNFQKGDLHVWQTKYGWQTANLYTHRYTNHKRFETLEDVLMALKNQEIKL
jgi:hypothetical protein